VGERSPPAEGQSRKLHNQTQQVKSAHKFEALEKSDSEKQTLAEAIKEQH